MKETFVDNRTKLKNYSVVYITGYPEDNAKTDLK
jgi:hypothetical protein